MSWNYEEIYQELLEIDSSLTKEDVFAELKRIEHPHSPSVSLHKGHALLDILESKCGFSLPVRFLTGTDLALFCENALSLNRRDAYKEMEAYCNMPTHSKIGVLFGLRSTGKTVIMQQLAGRKEYIHETAYTTLKYKQCMVRTLETHIRSLQARGIKYVFIDEICYADGFVEYCAGIADDFPSMKIIVSGTDSLSFHLASSSAWFHRTYTVSTTWMSYPEFNRVIGGDVLDYIKHGGVFDFYKYTLETYIKSSVIDNIYNTVLNIDRDSEGGEMIKLLSKQEFYNIVYAISMTLTVESILAKAAAFWGKEFAHGLDKVRKSAGIELIPKDYLEIISKSFPYTVTSSKYDRSVVECIIMYLKSIDFIRETPLRNDKGELKVPLSLTQPRIFWEFTRVVIDAVQNTTTLPEETRKLLTSRLNEHADGDILEPIILFALQNTNQAKQLGIRLEKFRTVNGSSEIDVVMDVPGKPLVLIEVKRSDKVKPSQVRNLCDPEIRALLSKIYGAGKFRLIVLYRGETIENGKQVGNDLVEYINIEEFLQCIENQ